MKLKPIALLDLPTVRNRLDPGSMALDDFRRSWGGELIFDAVAGTTAAVASYLDKPRVMRERLRAARTVS